MAYKFPSQEWVVQFVEEINRSEAYADAATTWEGDVLIVVEGQGGAYLDLWHGKCRNMEFLDDPTQKDAEFTLTATHV
jgi:putative sterol carrier protein